jgi:hypothetical protein
MSYLHEVAMRLTLFSCILTLATAAAAQPTSNLQPVDQTVGDADALAVSLRQVDPGNALYSGRTALYRPLDPSALNDPLGLNATRPYIFSAPGVRAYTNQPDYLVMTGPNRGDVGLNMAAAIDGGYMTLAPANVVYDLIPEASPVVIPADWNDTRLGQPIDSRVEFSLGVFDRRLSTGQTPTVEQSTRGGWVSRDINVQHQPGQPPVLLPFEALVQPKLDENALRPSADLPADLTTAPATQPSE